MDRNKTRQLTGRLSKGELGLLCYLLGAVSGGFILLRHYACDWSVRFHAIHSMLMTAVWAVAWAMLHLIEAISPWFLATLARELRFAMNLGFLLAWAFLLFAAYKGWRCVVVPGAHRLAVRLARRFDEHSARAEQGCL